MFPLSVDAETINMQCFDHFYIPFIKISNEHSCSIPGFQWCILNKEQDRKVDNTYQCIIKHMCAHKHMHTTMESCYNKTERTIYNHSLQWWHIRTQLLNYQHTVLSHAVTCNKWMTNSNSNFSTFYSTLNDAQDIKNGN